MFTRKALLGLLALAALALTGSSSAYGPRMTFLDNGNVRVGVDLSNGGKITYLGRASGDSYNLVYDVQQSYYSGAQNGQVPGWHAFASGGTVVDWRNDGRTIYTKAFAQDEFHGQCECTFETWATLDGSVVHVRNRLTAFRSDTTRYPAQWQELPALYSTGKTRRVFTYDGAMPYTSAPLREITDDAGGFFRPGPGWTATEHWAALVDDSRFGVGLFNPGLMRFSGIPGTPQAEDWGWVNGYLTSSTPEVLDANVSYSYRYDLVVGTLGQIRAYAFIHRPDERPNYRFTHDRQHWWEWNASDAGMPMNGALRVRLGEDDPQLIGPEAWWRAKAVPWLYVRGAWSTRQRVAELFWSDWGDGFSGDRRLPFRVFADGKFHTYRLDLAHSPSYGGIVTGLRLDPVAGPDPGSSVDLTCISFRPCPVDQKAEAALRARGPVPFLDNFDNGRVNTAFWDEMTGPGTGASVEARDAELEIAVPGTSIPDQTGGLTRGLRSRCLLYGNYDIQVDYRLLDWPDRNGVDVDFGVDFDRAMVRSNGWGQGEQVGAYFPPDSASTPVSDVAGSLRLTRRGSLITGWFRHNGDWVALRTATSVRDGSFVFLSVYTDSYRPAAFAHRDVRIAFDNFRISQGRLSCP
jgi:hypothetical protein